MAEYYCVISPEQTCTMTYTLHLCLKSFEWYSLFSAAELLNIRKYLCMELDYRAEENNHIIWHKNNLESQFTAV